MAKCNQLTTVPFKALNHITLFQTTLTVDSSAELTPVDTACVALSSAVEGGW